ncbi:MAG: transporter substrate-binding domain-containing protein [Deltaproteobacteria bacterium]|nr:transporter substrate-binding domain-containing protein [Deltaproteobacteria bacterium]
MKNKSAFFILVLVLTLFYTDLYARKIELIYVNFPPYEDHVNGKPAGILVRIVEQAFKRADIAYRLTFFPFKRGYNLVKDGKYDGLFNFYKIEKRLAYFDYSTPIIKNPLVFFVRKDSTLRYQSLDDLKGKKIGVMIGYTYGSKFDDDENIIKDAAAEHVHHLRKLVLGRLDAYPCDKMVGIYIARKEGLMGELKILPVPLKIMNGYIGFTKGRHTLVIKKINQQIKYMKNNGEINQIINNYIIRNKF